MPAHPCPVMPPLPRELLGTLETEPSRQGKRARTESQLLGAAIQVMAARGVGAATVLEIAAVAGVTPATVYNHFASREAIIQGVAVWLAETLCRRISQSQSATRSGAERMAIGNRRYIWLAEQSPAWALLMLEVATVAPELLAQVQRYVVADLRLGVRQGSFRVPSEAAALNVIAGAVFGAMRAVARGQAPKGHGGAVTTMVLRALGMQDEAATRIAQLPLPAFGPAEPAAGKPQASASRASPQSKTRSSALEARKPG